MSSEPSWANRSVAGGKSTADHATAAVRRARDRGADCCRRSRLGFTEDLGAVELLFTSLLVQAQKALAHAGTGAAGRRDRSSRFRSSFYLGYATRIGERLEAANAQVAAEADARALPVLRNRRTRSRSTWTNCSVTPSPRPECVAATTRQAVSKGAQPPMRQSWSAGGSAEMLANHRDNSGRRTAVQRRVFRGDRPSGSVRPPDHRSGDHRTPDRRHGRPSFHRVRDPADPGLTT